MQITEYISPDHIGYVAATMSTVSFVPQVLHTIKTKDVSGISLGMYSIFTAAVMLWLFYGLLISAWPLIIANGITLALASVILVLKLRYK